MTALIVIFQKNKNFLFPQDVLQSEPSWSDQIKKKNQRNAGEAVGREQAGTDQE